MKTCIGNLGDCSIAKSAAAILIGVGAFVAIAQPGLGQSPEPASPPASPLPLQFPLLPCLSPIFENVTLAPGFSPDPTTVRGISGGPQAASEIAGRAETVTGPCNGFVDTQPDHTLTLTQFFNYLRLQVQSSEDTTLVIRGPGGTWCNDDYSGKNPGLAGQWLSGTYEIWVGSYDETGFHPYVIRMTTQKD
ncbi:MAG: hypothetical protein EDM05_049945 [Leptolyngbya sp. IPPAS B-1204]